MLVHCCVSGGQGDRGYIRRSSNTREAMYHITPKKPTAWGGAARGYACPSSMVCGVKKMRGDWGRVVLDRI